jgi:hypothetical protein
MVTGGRKRIREKELSSALTLFRGYKSRERIGKKKIAFRKLKR